MYLRTLAAAAAATLLMSAPAMAAETQRFTLTIQNNIFTPEEIEVPADTKVGLAVRNLDDRPEEFHSDSLKREKYILAGQEQIIPVGPLKPGVYNFIGEFNRKTAKGRLVVK